MPPPRPYIGILTDVSRKKEKGKVFITGRIKSPHFDRAILFNEKGLDWVGQSDLVKDGAFVEFNIACIHLNACYAINTRTSIEFRLRALILKFNKKTLEFIAKYAGDKLKISIKDKIVYLDSKPQTDEIKSAVNLVKSIFPDLFNMNDNKPNRESINITQQINSKATLSIPHEDVTIDHKFEKVYFSNIRSILLQELEQAQESIQVAVAWFTNDDLFNVICNKLKYSPSIKVDLIINNDYINNWEHGLPFEKLIELGGDLYFSEFPKMMHHKFCIIDNKTLFNGSYNWTYYAENRNEENIILFKNKSSLVDDFRQEFERLKHKSSHVKLPIKRLSPSSIDRFERYAFREYFSTDVTLRIKSMKGKFSKTDAGKLASILNKALATDGLNKNSKTLLKKMEAAVELEKDIKKSKKEISSSISIYKNLQFVLALDFSNSMEVYKDGGYRLYSSGKIQEIVNKVFAINKALPSEQTIDTWLFTKEAIRLPYKITEKNYLDYIDKKIINEYDMGGTDLYAVMNDIQKKYIVEAGNQKNVFIILITDGEINNKNVRQKAEKYLSNNTQNPLFWQIVGLGEDFEFLKTLESVADNVSFIELNDVRNISADDLRKQLLKKFPIWFKAAQAKGITK